MVYTNKYFPNFCLIVLITLFSLSSSYSQSKKDSIEPYPIRSAMDLFKKKGSSKDTSLVAKPEKNTFFLIVPVIGSQPATGFLFGVTGQYTFKKNPKDRYSTINAGINYTTKKQTLINVKNNLFLKENKLFLSGDWRFYIFSQANYGLGSDLIPKNYSPNYIDSLAQPMNYNYVKFHQTFSWLVRPHFYVGTGLHLDGYTDIVDHNLDVANNKLTYSYEYNKKHGFSNTEYYVNGASVNLVYDTRDNPINTNNGWFWNINYRFNPVLGKNQAQSHIMIAETRYFIPMSKYNKQHVLAFWMFGQFLMDGDVPYLNLPAIGWDQRSRSGKGYTQGLIRGQSLINVETEYRFPITKDQLISGTLFANATTASDLDRNIKLFQYFQPAVGVGLRILVDKKTLTNLILNYGWGRDSKAFYLNAGETF